MGRQCDMNVSMPKQTNQIRLSTQIVQDAGMVAGALGKSVPQYIEEAVQAALARDLSRAAEILKKRAAESAKPQK